jgi:FlaA1/EpsC-like NDP-sugar epimerase
MDDCLSLLGRDEPLFVDDLLEADAQIREQVRNGSFLVIGGAGSIGQATVKELFKRSPRKLHVVDISENNMVELVRDLRSSLGYVEGDFRTFILDCGSREFDVFLRREGPFDYILNLSALKHVRSERDPYTLMHMIQVNILNANRTIRTAIEQGTRKYFCVSTDKATRPVNMMGASKRIMEMYLMAWSEWIPVSTARFANVAFSDGSLLHGFSQRVAKRQPLSAPSDIRRYFMTAQESGELCLMASLLGENRDIFFPKLGDRLPLTAFTDIARRYLRRLGFEACECASEHEARARLEELTKEGRWPCYFAPSDTTGEKDLEEFTTEDEVVDLGRFKSVGIIKNTLRRPPQARGAPGCAAALRGWGRPGCASGKAGDLDRFAAQIDRMRSTGAWTKQELVDLFQRMVPTFRHKEVNKSLDGRM